MCDISRAIREKLDRRRNFEGGDSFAAISESEVDEYLSQYGNRFVKITAQDLDSLLHGEVLYFNDGEYAMFIKFKEDEA